MDFLQRLIAGSGAVSPKKHHATTPSERLIICKRLCNLLQSIWRSSSSLTTNTKIVEQIAGVVRKLNSILEEEARKTAPYSCLHYIATNQTYIIAAKLAITSESSDVITASTHFFHLLVNSESDGLIDSKIFARSLIDLVRRCTAPATIVVDSYGETALIELLFEVATKARLDPGILPAWFYPERAISQNRGSLLEARRTQFPLFYILVDYVHNDAPIGDFARTALLYLTETASKSRSLEQWMLESDLAHQMASGLSALYSRLSRKPLVLDSISLPILGFSDHKSSSWLDDGNAESEQEAVRPFLSYLAFWQDTLTHCKSREVKDTMLEAFQILFVEQLLYPSLIESSDVQGGSTSAVLLNLCQILEATQEQALVARMLAYLFASRSPILHGSVISGVRMSLSRRASMESLAALSRQTSALSPDLFNLHDLIIFSLRSSIPQTIMAALRLVSVLLRKHHPHIRASLFKTRPATPNQRQNLHSMNNSMLALFKYVEEIHKPPDLDAMYQDLIEDSRTVLAGHSCLLNDEQESATFLTLSLSRDCRILRQIQDMLRSFLFNDTIVNIELTGVLENLAACQHVLMSSWFVDDEQECEDESVEAIFIDLVGQIRQIRTKYVEWDTFYSIQQFELQQLGHERTMSRNDLVDSSIDQLILSEMQGESYKQPATAIVGLVDNEITSLSASLGPHAENKIDVKVSPGSPTRTASTHALRTALLDTHVSLPMANPRHDESIADQTKDEAYAFTRTASLRHVLTQAIILQSLILSLAAMFQTRATLFEEVDLS